MVSLLNGCMGGGGPFPTKVTCTIASPDWDSYTSTDSNAERKILRAFSSRRKSATTTGSDQCKYKHTSKQYLHLSNRADKLCISRVTNSHSTWCLTISKNICANGTRMLLIDKQRINWLGKCVGENLKCGFSVNDFVGQQFLIALKYS